MTELPQTKSALIQLLQVETDTFEEVLSQAPRFYRCRWERKPAGGRRRIEEPGSSLKEIQRCLNHRLFQKLDGLPNVYPQKGTSHKDALKPHESQPVVVTLDIKDFFPSIRRHRLKQLFLRKGFCAEISNHLLRLVTYRGHLPQGAPSSSAIARLYILDLVSDLEKYLKDIPSLRITVFADDIVISGPEGTQRTIPGLMRLAPRYGLKINKRKIKVMRGQEQKALGVCMFPHLHLDKEFSDEAERLRDQGNKRSYQGKMAYKKFIER